jgi:hypothetical protein
VRPAEPAYEPEPAYRPGPPYRPGAEPAEPVEPDEPDEPEPLYQPPRSVWPTWTTDPAPVGPPALEPASPVREKSPEIDAPPRRRSPLIALLIIVVLAVIGGTVAATIAFVASRPDHSGGAPVATGSDSVAPSGAPTAASGAPRDLKLRDAGTSVTLTWTDPTAGTVSFIVAGGQQGALRRLQVVVPGTTTYTINGLNPKLEYCFTVAAVYGTDRVELSDLACTKRGSTSPSR